MLSMNHFGTEIIGNNHMADSKILRHIIKKKFIHRLFSLNPFRKYRVIVKEIWVPQERIIHDQINNCFYAHPKIIKKLEKSING